MTGPRYIIRCRETGLFLYRDEFFSGTPMWVDQDAADRFCVNSARRQLDLLESFKHCCHIVPEDWSPAWESDGWVARLRHFASVIYSFFRH